MLNFIIIIKPISKLLQIVFIGMIYFYRYSLSYFLGNRCRYSPSCSQFALTTFRTLSLDQAIMMSVKRIITCHNIKLLPIIFGKHFKPGQGYDPVSKYLKKN